MRALVAVLLHPTRTPPPPLAIDLRAVALAGAALFALAGVVCLVLALTGTTTWRPVEVCVVGVVLGLVGAEWSRRNLPATGHGHGGHGGHGAAADPEGHRPR
ncbi:DUF2530 domain-containing protein [Cellulomonas endophytica]|uniref:DUF2530 domain-containing protein n=1 Tax=Cellulomonas endophytica TaxID=2494735 RepID=UPI00196AA3E7|nr:DUF2530 domain-containing protein [Cellulomonas endophytica]